MSTVKPTGDRIAVKVIEGAQTSAGGIITNGEQETVNEGQVIAVGTARWFGESKQPLEIKEGDRVLFHKRSGIKYKTPEGEDLLLMREEEALAVVNQ